MAHLPYSRTMFYTEQMGSTPPPSPPPQVLAAKAWQTAERPPTPETPAPAAPPNTNDNTPTAPSDRRPYIIQALKPPQLKSTDKSPQERDAEEAYGYIQDRDVGLLETWLKCGGNPTLKNKVGRSLIAAAAAKGHTDIIQQLGDTARKRNIRFPREQLQAALLEAARSGHRDIVELLCSQYAMQPDVASVDWRQALVTALFDDETDAAFILLELGVQPELSHEALYGYAAMPAADIDYGKRVQRILACIKPEAAAQAALKERLQDIATLPNGAQRNEQLTTLLQSEIGFGAHYDAAGLIAGDQEPPYSGLQSALVLWASGWI